MNWLRSFAWILALTTWFFLVPETGAQTSMQAVGGARGSGMGNTFVNLHGISGAFGNPATLSQLSGLEVLLLARNRFLQPELNEIGIAAGGPCLGAFGALAVRQSGFSSYREQLFQASFAKSLAGNIWMGIRFDLGTLSLQEYGNRWFLNGSLGVNTALSREVQAGILIQHPFRQRGLPGEFMPPQWGVGMRYEPSPKTLFLLEFLKEFSHPASIRVGLEQELHAAVQLRTGMGTGPTHFSMGIGLKLSSNIRLDLASSYHQFLGFSPSIGIAFSKEQNNPYPATSPLP